MKNLPAPKPPPQIFVRGLSRSGGTLMASILDAHPDVAMSYETYEHLLVPSNHEVYQLPNLPGILKKNTMDTIRSFLFLGNQKADANLTKFIARAKRTGIDHGKLVEMFEQHFESGMQLNSFGERMSFVEGLTREKMRREGKICWGAKIQSVYQQLDELYPEARYLFMLRDGRDIAASRKKVGVFNQSMEDIARVWSKQIEKFEEFAAGLNGRAVFVPYERLAVEPEGELRNLMAKLSLPWSDRLLSFHELNLTIHQNSAGHLSGKQLRKPLGKASIGRWKTDLTADEIYRFEKLAGTILKKLGYS
jgi:hypothetical protein